MEEVGSSWKVNVSKKVMLVLLAVEVGTVKKGSRFLPSRWVLSRAIMTCAIKRCAIKTDTVKEGLGSCHEGGYRRSGF